MRKGVQKRVYSVALAAVAACALFLCSAFSPARLAPGVRIDGENFSRMPVTAAQRALREKLAAELEGRTFTVRVGGRTYTIRPPELYYRSDAAAVLRRARERGGNYALRRTLCVHRLEERIRGICADFYAPSSPARVRFFPEREQPFAFEREREGRYVDGAALLAEVRRALAAGEWEACAAVRRERPAFTLARAEESASLLASFSTRYAAGGNRASNIALAAQKLNGIVLSRGDTLSFNAAVGQRTAQNGFLEAPTILDGKYVPGVGGGVCQVSTTLYNAALLAGLTVTEYHPHSLPVGYVEPSFDAMVSGTGSDLKLKNELNGTVFFVLRACSGRLEARIYGMRSEVTFVRESVVTARIPPPEPEVAEGEARAGKEGLASEGWLIRREAGKPDVRVRLRRDRYAPVRGSVPPPAQEQGGEMPLPPRKGASPRPAPARAGAGRGDAPFRGGRARPSVTLMRGPPLRCCAPPFPSDARARAGAKTIDRDFSLSAKIYLINFKYFVTIE